MKPSLQTLRDVIVDLMCPVHLELVMVKIHWCLDGVVPQRAKWILTVPVIHAKEADWDKKKNTGTVLVLTAVTFLQTEQKHFVTKLSNIYITVFCVSPAPNKPVTLLITLSNIMSVFFQIYGEFLLKKEEKKVWSGALMASDIYCFCSVFALNTPFYSISFLSYVIKCSIILYCVLFPINRCYPGFEMGIGAVLALHYNFTHFIQHSAQTDASCLWTKAAGAVFCFSECLWSFSLYICKVKLMEDKNRPVRGTGGTKVLPKESNTDFKSSAKSLQTKVMWKTF